MTEIAAETIDVEDVETPPEQTFADLGVAEPIVAALADSGITTPFPIQALTLPVALTGADIIGQAKTGTGKTLGFGIPLLQRAVGPDEGATQIEGRAPQALVVVPTRELAQQVAEDLRTASTKRNLSIITIYGGKDFDPQLAALRAGVDVVVGTPGRLLDLYGRRALRLDRVNTAVFDEADEMLDLGFLPDVERIVDALPAHRQTMLFSATMPGPVISLARRYMNRPTHIRAQDPDDHTKTAKNTKQYVYRAHAMDKSEMVARLLQAEGRERTIIFARTKRTADRLAEELVDRGFNARPLHGDLNQQMRERALKAFREHKVDVLVATDVAARGIDIDDVTHVINYQCPDDEKTYVHRIGRTGRAGNTGIAVTFVDWDDMPRWRLISKALDLGLDEPVETYSTSPHFYEDLRIPAGTKGRLRRRKPAAGQEVDGETGAEAPRRSGSRRRSSEGRGDRSRDGGRAGAERSGDSAGSGDRPRRNRRRTRRGKPQGRASRAEGGREG
ncbi:superfamily II DNA/RNA helicase [Brevibacterium pityocampae]